MEYYQLHFEESNENYYFEVAEDRTVLRQVIKDEARWIVSSRPDEELHFCLYDQEFDQSMEDADSRDISAEQFEQVWNEAMLPHQKVWEKSKLAFPIGDQVTGIIEVFYPQGVILSLPNETYGLITDEDCSRAVPLEGRYPGQMLSTVVTGWDEVNMWLRLACV